jgi:hypothetical protein
MVSSCHGAWLQWMQMTVWGFVVGMHMKIPLDPPFSKGEVKQCNAYLKMVQRHNPECPLNRSPRAGSEMWTFKKAAAAPWRVSPLLD